MFFLKEFGVAGEFSHTIRDMHVRLAEQSRLPGLTKFPEEKDTNQGLYLGHFPCRLKCSAIAEQQQAMYMLSKAGEIGRPQIESAFLP